MKIIVNGVSIETEAATLEHLLSDLGKSGDKIATAVNEMFVPATARGSHTLSEGDRIEIVAPRQGG